MQQISSNNPAGPSLIPLDIVQISASNQPYTQLIHPLHTSQILLNQHHQHDVINHQHDVINQHHDVINKATHSSDVSILSASQATNLILQPAVQSIETPETESDKRVIYKHPLFPLMALLLEKCELAAAQHNNDQESFEVDIHAFVQQQEQSQKPFLTDDAELDNLMLKSIQVLRIHLLELEKVTDLCGDFCNRYISCLKGKLQSDSLLRVDNMGDDADFGPVINQSGGSNMAAGSQPSQTAQSQQQQQQAGQQLVSGGTVYQMVQTPQGIVAQPIQIQTAAVPAQQTQQTLTSSYTQQQAAASNYGSCPVTSSSVIHGSTPLSQIGLPSTPSPADPLNQTVCPVPDDDGGPDGGQNQKRGVLPKQATAVMKSWLFQHIIHPYPTEDEKRQIAQQTNLSLLQVNNWFINARRRILQPMLESSDPSNPSKNKKSKPQAARPMQRFWPESIANIQPQNPSLHSTSSNSETDDSNPNEERNSYETEITSLSHEASATNVHELHMVTDSQINDNSSQYTQPTGQGQGQSHSANQSGVNRTDLAHISNSAAVGIKTEET